MDEIEGLDRLNAAIRFGPDGTVTEMDQQAVERVLADLSNPALARELNRCFVARSFADNCLIELSETTQPKGVFMALMSTPYLLDDQGERKVSLQAFRFVDQPPSAALRRSFAAETARPVRLRAATQGIRDTLRFVVCFRNSLLGRVPADHKDEFYFVDKLADVYSACIHSLLHRLWDQAAFTTLKDASREDLLRAAAIWVHLHEHFHAVTRVPISRFSWAKATQLSGAFEELRVDLCALLADLVPHVGTRMAAMTTDLILAFRLVYYGSSFDPKKNYDAVTSVALSNILTDAGCLSMTPACQYAFSSDVDLQAALQAGLTRLNAAEERVAAGLSDDVTDDRAQEDLRALLEQAMRELCRTPRESPVARGDFHQTHSGSLLGDDLEKVL